MNANYMIGYMVSKVCKKVRWLTKVVKILVSDKKILERRFNKKLIIGRIYNNVGKNIRIKRKEKEYFTIILLKG